MDYGIIAVFGALVLVAVLFAVLFRRRSLGTKMRVILSVLAVALLGVRLVRDQGVSPGTIALVLVAAAILGAGIWYLRGVEQEKPPAE